MCSRVLTFLVANKELLRAEKFLSKYILKITLVNAAVILLFLYFIDRGHIDKVYVAPFIAFMIINVLLQIFFGLYFYKEKFAFKTIAYIILTPLVMVFVPYYFGEIGKYIMTGVILLVVGIVIMRRNQRDSC